MTSPILLDMIFTRASNHPLLFVRFTSLNENLMTSNWLTNRFRHCSFLNTAAVLLFRTVPRSTFSISSLLPPMSLQPFLIITTLGRICKLFSPQSVWPFISHYNLTKVSEVNSASIFITEDNSATNIFGDESISGVHKLSEILGVI
jgi:hypothetical protein